MAFTKLASFPNSRIKPRPVTRVASTEEITVPSLGVVTIPANVNRSYLTLFNTDPTNPLRYGYDLALVATEGFLLIKEATIDLESPEPVYVFNPNGVNVAITIDEGSG
jgi:hypothetical protein